MRGVELSDHSGLVDEIERNLWETWSHWGRGPGCELHDDGEVLWFETPLPVIPYNGVLKFRVQDNVSFRIDQITEQFRTRKVGFVWVVHPSSSPADLTRYLKERGLKDAEPIFGMARGLSDLPAIPPVPDSITARKVTDEADADAFVRFAAWRWHVPEEYRHTFAGLVSQYRIGKPGAKAHMWQAWRDNQPVAKAGMFLGSGSAGIYAVVSKPEAARLGLAKILTLTALHAARHAGHHLAVLHSTPMAEALYRSLGFSTIVEFRLFASDDVYI